MVQPPELLELLKFLKLVEMDECQDLCLISLLSGRKMTDGVQIQQMNIP